MREKEPQNIQFGKNLKYFRQNRGMSVELLAEFTFTDPKHITRLENGHHTPSLEKVLSFAVVLEVSVDDLIEGMEKYAKVIPREERLKRLRDGKKRYKQRIRKTNAKKYD